MKHRHRKDNASLMNEAFDEYARALTVINEEHRMNHDGMMFHATYRWSAVANSGNADWLLRTVASNYPHIVKALVTCADTPMDIKTYQSPTVSASGTAITSYTTNFNSSNTPDLLLYHTPTITDVGTLVHDRLVPSQGTGVGTDHGFIIPGSNEEWILAPSSDYLFRVTNNTGGTSDIVIEMSWYEIGY
jgi:hypothetical protein